MTDKNILLESTSVPLLLKLRSSTKRTSFSLPITSAICKHPGNTCPSARGSPRKTGRTDPAARHHRFRRTRACQPSWHSVHAGGYRSFHIVKSTGSADRRCHRTRRRGCQNHLFEGGNVEQRMNGICAGGTGSFIDQMASLLQTDATGLNEYAKHYQAIYPIAARCGVFAKRISSRSSTTVQQKRILPLLFSRQSSTRPFPVLPAVNQSAATLPSLAARCTSSRN